MISHKLLRLACPWALGVLVLTSAVLAAHPGAALWKALFAGQVVFYGLAAAGARAGKLGAIARTFVVLNAAAIVGFWRFLRGSQAVTWQVSRSK
jgi:hypothetical protein